MKIVVATDSFKGSIKSYEACEIIAAAISECAPRIEVVTRPMADGGDSMSNRPDVS